MFNPSLMFRVTGRLKARASNMTEGFFITIKMDKKIYQKKESDYNSLFNFDEILKYYRVEKIINTIKEKASKKFEELASFGDIKPSNEYYERSKEIFINDILIQCSKNNLLKTIEVVPPNSKGQYILYKKFTE